jgi:ribosomal protein S12 methylthiotransferase accessory factor
VVALRLFGQNYSGSKGYTAGTHRTRSPAETLLDYAPLMETMGITRLANVTGLDTIGLPVYVAIRPTSRALATSQGKGADPDAAKASALMESIECWHAERIDRPLRQESYLALRRQAHVLDVTRIDRRAGSTLKLELPLLWIEGWDLLCDAPVWVPFEAVSANFVHGGRSPATFFQSTNGLASGNHMLEAIVHALCEVIERDAVTLWFLEGEAQQKAQQVDLSTVTDPYCVNMLTLLARAGVFCAVWDITSDTGVPTYAATILEGEDRPRWRAMGAFSGYGCHLAPEVAFARAVSEAVQSRLTMISGSRDDLFPRHYVGCSNEDDRQKMLRAFSTPAPTSRFDTRRSLVASTFEEDVATLLSALRAIGVTQAAVVDLSRPDVGIPVVKVVVPGLEGLILASAYHPGAGGPAGRGRGAGPTKTI